MDEGDVVTIEIPDEQEHETLIPVKHDLNIAYEDEHFLILNKPHGYASIPSILHSNTIANFVKNYYLEQNYPNKQVHIGRVWTRTSGLMLFAKHGHAYVGLINNCKIKQLKRYYALVSTR